MSTTAYHDPSAGGSSHVYRATRNSHYRPDHSSLGADGYHVSSTDRDDTYVQGQYAQRPRDYEYGESISWTHDASLTQETNGNREGYLGYSEHKSSSFASPDKIPRQLFSGREHLAAHKTTAKDSALSTGPVPAYQGGKGNVAETSSKNGLQKKLGQSSGLADSMAGTLLSLTVVRTFREMTTQTTEDDMNGDTVWNGVRISCLPSSSHETAPVSKAGDQHRSTVSTVSTDLPSWTLKTSHVENEQAKSIPPIHVNQASRPPAVAQSLLDAVNSLPSSARVNIAAAPEKRHSAHEQKKEAETQQGNKQQFTQDIEKGKEEKEKEPVSWTSEPEVFTSSTTPDSQSTIQSNATPASRASASIEATSKIAENDPWTSTTPITVTTTPKVVVEPRTSTAPITVTAKSDPWTSTTPITVATTPVTGVEPQTSTAPISITAKSDPWTSTTPITVATTPVSGVEPQASTAPITATTAAMDAENDPWTSTKPITVATTPVPGVEPQTSTAPITATTTPKVSEDDPWTSTAPITVTTTPKASEDDPWTSTAPITVTVTPKASEDDPWTSTAPITVTTTPKVADVDPRTSTVPIAATTSPTPKTVETDPWTSTTPITVPIAPKATEADPWTSTTPVTVTTAPTTAGANPQTSATTITATKTPKQAESDSKSSSTTAAARATSTIPLFSWTATEANKGAGAMVDWSTGRVAEFPAEDKPKRMPVTGPWERSYGAELEEGPTHERNAPQQWQDKDPGVSKDDPRIGENESRGRERDRGSTRRHNTERGGHEQEGFDDQQPAQREQSGGPHQQQEGRKKSSIRSTSVSSNSSSSTTSSSRMSGSHQSTQLGSQHQHQQRTVKSGSPDRRGAPQGRKPLTSAERFEQSLSHSNYADSQHQDGSGSAGGAYRTSTSQPDPSHGYNSYGQSNKGSGYGFNNNTDQSRPFADTHYGRAGYHNTGPGGRGSGSHSRYNPQPQQPFIQRQYGGSNTAHPTFQQQQPYYQQHQQYQASFQHNQYSQPRQQPRPGYGYNNRPQGNVNKNAGRPPPSHGGSSQYSSPNVVTVSIPEGSDFSATAKAVLRQSKALDPGQPTDSTGSASMTSDFTFSSRSSSPDSALRNQRSASLSSAVSGMDSGAGVGSGYQNLSTAADTHTGHEVAGAPSKKLATSNDFSSFLQASKAFVPPTASGSIPGHKGHKKKAEYADSEREYMRGDQAGTATTDQAALTMTGRSTSVEDNDRANSVVRERGIGSASEAGSNSAGQDAPLEVEKNVQIQAAPVSNTEPSLICIADDEAIGGPPASGSSTGSDTKKDMQ